MDLNLDLTDTRLIGRKRRELFVTEVGELCAADIAVLSEERGIKAVPLKRLSDRHHQLAKSLASGMGQSEAAYANGYAPSSVSILCADEAFKELLAHYRTIPEAAYADLHDKLAGMSMDAADEIQRRMDEDREREAEEDPQLSTGQLMNILTMGADRTGHGPQTKSTHLHVHANLADRLEAARKRVAAMKDVELLAHRQEITSDNASGTGSANEVINPEPQEIEHERSK